MIPVEEALARILATPHVTPTPVEPVSLDRAGSRVLARDISARLSQPPADVSAMDGWAMRHQDGFVGATLIPIGEAAAGHRFQGRVTSGQTVRIFTGAYLPEGADAILIQENAVLEGQNGAARVTVTQPVVAGRHIRAQGGDFACGALGLRAGKRLSARDLALAAAMNHPWLPVHRRPRIALLATGDELVQPGEPVAPGQIVGSARFALAALVEAAGGQPVPLETARDQPEALRDIARGATGCDLLVTVGGISVGDYDQVRSGLALDGFALDFWKIAMRPGKPLMFGHIDAMPVLGLPGNPVASFVCALLFLRPLIERLSGLTPAAAPLIPARLGRALPANDHRQDYLRTRLARDTPDGIVTATPFEVQDSAQLATLAAADGLLIRPPLAPAAAIGAPVAVLAFDGVV